MHFTVFFVHLDAVIREGVYYKNNDEKETSNALEVFDFQKVPRPLYSNLGDISFSSLGAI